MSIKDGIEISGLHSYRDFDLCIKSRNIGLPEKKTIRQTVPFMNGYYDFSDMNGAPAWGERPIEFVFDIIADSPQELDAEVARVTDWLCNVQAADIYDDTMPDYHWHGSYENCDTEYDDYGLSCVLTVTFVVHPFKISNQPIEYTMQAGTYSVRNLGMVVAPYVKCDLAAAVQVGTIVTSIPANTEVHLEADLVRGENTIIVTGDSAVRFWWYEEVM